MLSELSSIRNFSSMRLSPSRAMLSLIINTLLLFLCIPFSHCVSINTDSVPLKQSNPTNSAKRGSRSRCFSRDDCDMVLPGSLCLNETCVCPQGFNPNSDRSIGCFQTGKLVGESCNISAQCGDDLSCSRHICVCPEGLQHISAEGNNFCLVWHRPPRLERCRSYEDCTAIEPNAICRKHWCQCGNGFQLFQTLLFGLRHKCFKTYKTHCHSPRHCTKLAQSTNQYCICHFGYCHCTPNSNATSLDIYRWMNEKPNWVEIWKRDMIIALRLMSMTAVLFFVPCLVYLVLGLTGRRRLMFFQLFCPSLNTQYTHRRNNIDPRRRNSCTQRRNLHNGNRRNGSRNSVEPHNVVIALGSHGVNSHLVNADSNNSSQRVNNVPSEHRMEATAVAVGNSANQKNDDDALPTYEEIMRQDRSRDAPPPAYHEL